MYLEAGVVRRLSLMHIRFLSNDMDSVRLKSIQRQSRARWLSFYFHPGIPRTTRTCTPSSSNQRIVLKADKHEGGNVAFKTRL